MVSPRCAALIAEHSICQPGRPRPQGLSQPGSSGVEGFHSTKSAGFLLVRRHLDAGAGDHFLGVAAGQRAVGVVGAHVEQHVALGGVGMAAGDQRLDHRDDLADVRGGVRLDVRRRDAQRGHVLAVGGGEAVGDRADRHALLDARRH